MSRIISTLSGVTPIITLLTTWLLSPLGPSSLQSYAGQISPEGPRIQVLRVYGLGFRDSTETGQYCSECMTVKKLGP